MDTYDSLAALIKDRRRAMNLTQEDLADAVGRSQKWSSDIERGVIKTVHISLLPVLAQTLGVAPEDIVLASGMADSRDGAVRVVASNLAATGHPVTAEVVDEVPPHMRASFAKVSELSPERQDQLKSLIDTFYEADEAYRAQIRKDAQRRREEDREE